MKTLVTSFMLVLLLTACSSDEATTEQNNTVITEQLIGKGDLYGNGAEEISQQNLVITNQTEWEALQTKMNTTNPCTTSFTETDIDFNEWTLIAVFDAIRPSGGHSIDIMDVVENRDAVTVTVGNVLPGDMTTVMTQPFHIVKIPATNKPVIFE